MSKARSELKQKNIPTDTLPFQARKLEQQTLHNDILQEEFTQLLQSVKEMCELSTDYTIQLDPCFYLCPEKALVSNTNINQKDWQKFTTTLYKDCRNAGIFIKSNLDDSNPIEISNRVDSSKKFLLITDQDYAHAYKYNDKFSAGMNAAVLHGLEKSNFRIIPVTGSSEASIPNDLRKSAHIIDFNNQSYYSMMKSLLQFIYNIPDGYKEFEDLWNDFSIKYQKQIKPLQKEEVFELLEQEHEAEIQKNNRYEAMSDKLFENLFSSKTAATTSLSADQSNTPESAIALQKSKKDESQITKMDEEPSTSSDFSQQEIKLNEQTAMEENFSEFPDKIILESLKEFHECNNYLNFQRRDKIGTVGFEEFLGRLQAVDPAGDFTNLIKMDYTFDDWQGTVPRLCLASNVLLPSGKNTDIYLSSSDILNLAGDVFSSFKKPISFTLNKEEQKSRFMEAYNALIDPNNYDKLMASLIKLNEYTRTDLSELAFEKKIDTNSNSLNYVGSKNNKDYATTDFCSKHLSATTESLDHFGKGSYVALIAGLSIAYAKAASAANLQDEDKKKLITEALTYALFACHFLVDMYTLGHINLPVKEMFNAIAGSKLTTMPMLENVSSTKKMMGLLLLSQMHQESCEKPVKLRKEIKASDAPPDPRRWDNLPQENEGEGYETIQTCNDTQPDCADTLNENENQPHSSENTEKQFDFELDKACIAMEQKPHAHSNYQGEGCEEQYDFSADQACEAITLVLYDIYLIYQNPMLLDPSYRKMLDKPLFFDQIQKTMLQIKEQEKNLLKDPLFKVIADNSIEVHTDKGYKTLCGLNSSKNLVSMLSMFYEFKTKKKDNNPEVLTKSEMQDLVKNLENANCTFRS